MLDKTNLHSLIKDKELFKEKGYIGGTWVESLSSKKFEVFNPSTGELIATVPDMGVEDTKEAIEKAHDAFASWSKKTAKERANILHKFFQLMVDSADDLSIILTAEMGKPLAEAKGEIVRD